MVILVTGKSGAGKTTYSYRLAQEIREKQDQAIVIDGDDVRSLFENDFTDNGRARSLEIVAKIAALAERQGITAIVSVIAPKREWRDRMRGYWRNSRIIYIPGGTLWESTSYEMPDEDEIDGHIYKRP